MIVRALTEVPQPFGPSAVTIGNFDGVHLGHRALMERLVTVARENQWTPVVLTFDPHPSKLVAPDRAPRLLTGQAERCALMREQGIERIVILPFTREVAALEPAEFVRKILAEKLEARAVLVGENFRFGHRASGNVALLRKLGQEYGFVTEALAPVRLRGRIVSSSEVRKLVESGNVSLACRFLGRPFVLAGAVVPGYGVGSKQTVPTLNLKAHSEVLPAHGVYITRTFDEAGVRHWDSITNVGMRPTFQGDHLTVETFLLSPFDGASPAAITVEFLRRVREERKFESADELKRQIFRDVARAQSYFRRRHTLKLETLSHKREAS